MKFSVVSTVFNEFNRIDITIKDLESQILKPSEIIIVDAGSTDGTFDVLKEWSSKSQIPIKLLILPRCNVAEGRNLAIKNSENDLIVSMDFGCRFTDLWLADLIKPFVDKPETEVVAGGYTVIEKDQKSLFARSAFIIYNGYLPDLNPEHFIPSSRSVAYKKTVFDKIGGYPEWLTLAGDDSVFGQLIRAKQFKMEISRPLNVFWGRHTTKQGFLKEAQRYGLGDGEAQINFKIFIKTAIDCFLLWVFLGSLVLLVVHNSLFIFSLIIFILSLYRFRSYYLILKNWLKFRSPKYNFKVLLNSFLLWEKIKFQYFKFYYRGYFFSSKLVKTNAAKLSKELN